MTSESDQLLTDHKRQIRDFIQHPRRLDPLLRDKSLWFRLTSAMDAIEDTESAIDAYIASPEPSRGGAYLLLYGVLQALFVQQDATKHLQEAFGIKPSKNSELTEIRDIRNCTIGHPTSVAARKADNLPASSNYIVQMSVTKGSFRFMRAFETGETTFRDVDVMALIRRQREIVKQVLQDVWRILQERDHAHRDQYKDQKLAQLFPATLNYMFEQVSKATREVNNRQLGAWGVEGLTRALDELREALEERGILNESSDLRLHFTELEHPLSELAKYMAGQRGPLDDNSAPIYVFYVREKFDDLRNIAAEIDREYSGEEDDEEAQPGDSSVVRVIVMPGAITGDEII